MSLISNGNYSIALEAKAFLALSTFGACALITLLDSAVIFWMVDEFRLRTMI